MEKRDNYECDTYKTKTAKTLTIQITNASSSFAWYYFIDS